jgi:hypothetical protein
MLRGDSSTIHAFGLDQKPFSDLLKVLFSKFGLRYGSTRFLDMDSIDSAAAAAEVQEKVNPAEWSKSFEQELNKVEQTLTLNNRNHSIDQASIRLQVTE